MVEREHKAAAANGNRMDTIREMVNAELDARAPHDIDADPDLKNITLIVMMDRKTGVPTDVRFRKESYKG
jgi:hypothetical protein